ncbi:carboxypeptidase-like regulatory domain-containing protein, partial [bacterium]|nr:carboxypeptidase-like regulatory domain-containing protein [bacterium]
DAVKKTPIANVNIWFKNTGIGIKSNDEGFFMIRNAGSETTLVFSCVGYRTKELKLQLGKSVGVQVELQQTNTELQEVFVLPGTNPALELMKRVRAAKVKNNVRGNSLYKAETQEQSLVLLANVNQRAVNQRIFEQLAKGAVEKKDSLLTLPLFMSEQNYAISGKNKTQTSKDIFNSDAQNERIIEQLAGNFSADINFYQSAFSLFDKEFISPLADAGVTYYNYYLIDSLQTTTGKE